MLGSVCNGALESYDVLVMPTAPITPYTWPTVDFNHPEQVGPGLITDVGVFNVTGNSATSVPGGMSDGLPVGLMLIGGFWDEAKL